MNIFICHTPSDLRTASKLALDLMKRGFDVWIDQPNPLGEQEPPSSRRVAIQNAIQKSHFFIVITSPAAMAFPDIYEQVALAVEYNLPILMAVRQEAYLLSKLEKLLGTKDRLPFDREQYSESLKELINRLGADPDKIVNDIISPLEVEEWLPGTWSMTFRNANSDVDGVATFDFGPDHEAEGVVTVINSSVTVRMHVTGEWGLFNDRFTVHGSSKITMSIKDAVLPESMTYILSLKIRHLYRGMIEAESSVGDKVMLHQDKALNPPRDTKS